MTMNTAYKYKTSSGLVTITGYNGNPNGNLVIPHRINGYPVNAIETFAFSSTKFSAVNIPNTVNRIGAFAFGNNSFLSTVIIESSHTSINNSAFGNCPNLKLVIIEGKIVPKYIPNKVEYIVGSSGPAINIWNEMFHLPWDQSLEFTWDQLYR